MSALLSRERTPMKLPVTIEGATQRYFLHYKNRFRGADSERVRLQGEAEAKLVILRRRAPHFYENKLLELINQAAQALLAPEISTDRGIIQFHDTHRTLLKVLDELIKSQPSGKVDFQREKDRVKKRDEYLKRHLYVRHKINELESLEFEDYELGDETPGSRYIKVFTELDKLKEELQRLSIIIAKMEGEKIEEEILFKLKVPPRTVLSRLPASKIDDLETQIQEFLCQNKQNVRSMFYDKSIIEGMIAKLNIDPNRFSNDEITIDLPKEALDAYKKFYRDLENKRRDEWYENLLQNKKLQPKEGRIISHMDDVPDDVRQQLEESETIMRRRLDICCEEFNRRSEEVREESAVGDLIEPLDSLPAYERTYAEVEAMAEQDGYLFRRIKEEPRDDYEENGAADDQVLVPESVADTIEDNNRNNNQTDKERASEDDGEISDYQDAPAEVSTTSKVVADDESAYSSDRSKHDSNDLVGQPSFTDVVTKLKNLFDSDDEDILMAKANDNSPTAKRGSSSDESNRRAKKSCSGPMKKDEKPANASMQILGTVTPQEKVEVIQIDDV